MTFKSGADKDTLAAWILVKVRATQDTFNHAGAEGELWRVRSGSHSGTGTCGRRCSSTQTAIPTRNFAATTG